MEFITLNPTTFQPENLIENSDSIVWTERYGSYGDFELITSDIGNMIQALPRESYVSLRDTNVVMIVEDHKITKKPGQVEQLKVTGRSFETVLERRGTARSIPATTARTAWMENMGKESDAAYRAMRMVLGDPSPRYPITGSVLTPVSPFIANDAIPEIDLILPADYDAVTTSKSIEIKLGNLYDVVRELIDTNHHGIKAVRPEYGSNKVGIEIYNGADLTNTVRFDAHFDQFDDATYLLSQRGSANVAYVYGAPGSDIVFKNTGPEPAGLARRVLVIDESSDNTLIGTPERTARGLVELYKFNATALFDGEIAEYVASGYNTRYFLGDILKLVGEYGLDQNVRVAEFIRTSDSTGEKAYPAFEAVE